MEQLRFITKQLDIKDSNIKILDIINKDTHKEIIAKLDYEPPSCPNCGSQMKKYDFQKSSKIPLKSAYTFCFLPCSMNTVVWVYTLKFNRFYNSY